MKLSWTLRGAALACLALTSLSIASGTNANLSWIAPTTYNDGTPLDAIDHYTLTWSPATGQQGPSGSLNVPGSSTKITVNLPCGSTSFTVSVTTGPGARYPSTTSSPTNPVPYATGVSCTPNPPTGLAAQ